MSKIIVYGIPHCDTIKKTRDWLKKNKVDFEFHDYKKSGITKDKLTVWCKQIRWEVLLNKQSSTWRGLVPELQEKITSQSAAIKLMTENTSIIKRPVIETGQHILVGFTETAFIKHLK